MALVDDEGCWFSEGECVGVVLEGHVHRSLQAVRESAQYIHQQLPGNTILK
jgi:hypothetical protein